MTVLNQDRLSRVLEDDVVLWIATAELGRDLRVKIVLFVLRLPIAERHAQGMNQRAVDVAPVFGRGSDLVFGNEDKIVRARPALEQVFERFAHHRLTVGARYLAKVS